MSRIAILLLFLSALAVGAVCVRVLQREAAAETDYPAQGRIVTVDGTAVHVEIMGKGPDVVLIHGGSGNTRDMTFRLAPLLAERYRVLVFDRPGLGYSDRLPGDNDIAAQARQLRDAAAAIGADRPIVLGHSYGAAVAFAWAVYHPRSLAAVVTVSAATHEWPSPPPLLTRVADSRIGGAVVVPLITAFASDDHVASLLEEAFAPQEVPDGYAAWIGVPLILKRAAFRANAGHQVDLRREMMEQERHYGRIAVPVEILHGTADPIVPIDHAKTLEDRVPGAVLTPLEGIGHMAHQVAPEAVGGAIDRAAERAGLK